MPNQTRSLPLRQLDQELIAWAHKNLQGLPAEENDYDLMIGGGLYRPDNARLAADRMVSTEKCQEYGDLRLRNFDGNVDEFVKARAKTVRNIFGQVGKAPFIEAPLNVDYGYNVSVGDNFYSNFNMTLLDCSVIRIGSDVMLGPNVTITTASHPLDATERMNGLEFSHPVTIGDRVWIGANSVILPGVNIGDEVVIAAGAVVSKDVPSNVVVAGVPARVIKQIGPGDRYSSRNLQT